MAGDRRPHMDEPIAVTRVAWLHTHFLSQMGGTKFVYEYIKRRPPEVAVRVVVERSRPEVNAMYRAIGVDVVELGRLTSNSPLYWLSLPWGFASRVRKARRTTADCEVIISSLFPMNWLAMRLPQRHVCVCYEPYPFLHDAGFIRQLPLVARLGTQILRIALSKRDIAATRSADLLFTLSDKRVADVQAFCGCAAEVIYAGVDTDFFRPVPEARQALAPAVPALMLHQTDFTAIKGTDLLLQAMPLILAAVPDAQLWVTYANDSAPGRRQMERLAAELGIADRIRWVGFVPEEQLPRHYSAADVVVQPSRNQSHSMTVKEAMACGTAVVRSIDPCPEFADGESGIMVDCTDAQALAGAIVRMLSDEPLRRTLGAAAREYAVQHHSWDASCGMFWSAVTELAAQRR